MENMKQGLAAIGLRSKTHVVMACVNKANSELSSHQKKIFKVDNHIGVAIVIDPSASITTTLMSRLSLSDDSSFSSPIRRRKFYFERTGWLTIALLPTPVAFILLAASSGTMALYAGTALIGLSSGFIFAAAVSITSELFGPNSVGVNHNILITNIPLGSLVYGFLAAIVYDANVSTCIFVLGLASSVLLFLRTRHAYDHFEHNRSTQLY